MRRVVFAILAVLIILLALGGIGWALGYRYVPGYANSGKYTAGGATLEGAIENLDVDWLSGPVDIVYHDGDTVEIAETADKPISDDQALRWWLDGSTLRVRYTRPGLIRMRNLSKHLTITLPEGISLDGVSLKATSGILNLAALEARTLDMSVTSGEIHAVASAGSISLEATSGTLDLTQRGSADSVSMKVTSGGISAQLEDADTLRAETTSGGVNVTVSGEMKDAAFKTTSGGINAEINRAGAVDVKATSGSIAVSLGSFDALAVDVTSGDVRAALPDEPGFTAQVSLTSGRFDSDIPLTTGDGAYTCGDGSGSVRIHATSGNIRLEKAE